MDRIPQRDQPQEGRTAKPTAKAGQRPWEISQYIYPEEPENAKRSSHSDPRLEFALQSHGQHQDSDFIPHDEESDHQSLHPAFGFGTTPDLNASASSAGDLGTLAGWWTAISSTRPPFTGFPLGDRFVTRRYNASENTTEQERFKNENKRLKADQRGFQRKRLEEKLSWKS